MGGLGPPIYVMAIWLLLRTPRRAAARVALHAGAVPHQREVAALAAHLALVALGLGLGAAVGLARRRLLPVERLQCLLRRQLCFRLGLERGGAGGVQRRDGPAAAAARRADRAAAA